MKKHKNQLFDDITSHSVATAGAVGMTGLVGKLPSSPQTGKISNSMGMLNIPLTINAARITFNSFNALSDVEKKIKKRK